MRDQQRLWTVVMALVFATSCGGGGGGAGVGGGGSGTGISTLTGNVSQVTVAETATERIRVEIADTSFATTTDSAGVFELRGSFAGDLTLRFTRTTDGLDARFVVRVPRGGRVELGDVVLEGDTARPGRQRVAFEGALVTIDCEGGTLVVESLLDPRGVFFAVRLAGATLRGPNGAPLACIDLVPGVLLAVRGTVGPDGSIGEAEIDLLDDDDRSDDDSSDDDSSDDQSSDDGADDDASDDQSSDDDDVNDGPSSDDDTSDDASDGDSDDDSSDD